MIEQLIKGENISEIVEKINEVIAKVNWLEENYLVSLR